MRAKSVLLLAVALGCGTVAAVAANQVIKDQGKGAPAVQMVDILVASKDVAVNTKITADRFKLEKWPADRIPQGAIKELKVADGKFTNQRLYQGEPLLERKVNLSNESIAQTIPPGCKVFDLPVDANNGGVGYIQPGHRVDIHGFFEKNGRILESKSLLVMENVEVLMVDGIAVREHEEGPSKRAGTIQLLIRSSQYEALNTAKNLGRLTLALRPLASDDEANQKTDNGDDFLAWVRSSVQDEVPQQAATLVTEPTIVASPSKKQAPKKRMVVFSPNATDTYAWSNDDEIPQKVIEASKEEEETLKANAEIDDASPSDSSNSQGLPNGMVWDGQRWIYNPSGFKPAYPSADDDRTK
ncbi:MAG: Flp pilus assembly protein CpaB [Pirellulaceae bacterium]|nr:Flp pilus assembly protein CpaB [Pirellulaceae bacterium]